MRVFVLGDSISMDYGPDLERFIRPWASYARKEDDGSELGANGGDSAAVAAYLGSSAAWREADVVLLNCGLHDLKVDRATGEHQVPIDDYEATLRGVVAQVLGAGPRLVWVSTTPVDDRRHEAAALPYRRTEADVRAYGDRAGRVMSQAAVPAIELHAFTSAIGGERYRDHVHFTERVQELQAAFIAGWLRAWCTALPPGAMPDVGGGGSAP